MEQEMVTEEDMGEKAPFFSRIKKLFSGETEKKETEEVRYKRRFFDGRIERYLDENFNNYIEEFGLVTRIDTLEYEERYQILAQRISNLKTFINGTDADLSSLERRLKTVNRKASSTSKKGKKK